MTFFLLPPDWAEGCGTKRPEASIAPVIVRISRRVTDVIWMPSLGLLGGEEVQTSVKFVKLLSPHPGSFLKALMPLPMGEVGRGPGEGSVADGAALLGGLSLLATYCVRVRRSRHAQNDSTAEATAIRTN